MNYIYSIIPTIIIAIFIYKLDKHKEPLKLLIELFIGGILSTFIVLLLTISLRLIYPNITIINNSISSIRLFINIFITIGIIEEFSKWIITYKISYNHKEFDEIFDIIVYSIFVSLGFATLENILYVVDSETVALTAIIRGFLSIPAHTALGIIMGSFLGLAKISEINKNYYGKKQYLLYSIIIPIELHTIFDFCAISTNKYVSAFFYIYIVILFIFAIIIVRQFTKKNIKMKPRKKTEE